MPDLGSESRRIQGDAITKHSVSLDESWEATETEKAEEIQIKAGHQWVKMYKQHIHDNN